MQFRTFIHSVFCLTTGPKCILNILIENSQLSQLSITYDLKQI